MRVIGLTFGCAVAVILRLFPCCFSKEELFPLDFPFPEEVASSDEYEEELAELEKRGDEYYDEARPKGWSSWSPWMTCSRSCDGGISRSHRKCRGKCPGGQTVQTRRQICNMQPCPEPNNFRATQCSAYNDVPYRERKYVWLPFYDPEDPCSLTCQAQGYNFVAKLSRRVQDGTRCREGALDMCVQGKCQPIGCDLRVGSTLKVDECGICGGDGSKCQRPTFIWQEGIYAPCSVTCGGGVQLSEATCRNKETNEEVDPRLCNLSIRPRPKAKHCNRHPCPVVWATGEWGPCSATCGAGIQSRPVFCVQGGPNGSQIDVKTEFCPRHKPLTEKTCFVEECPRWFQGPWSPCSATCGQGIQTRAVVCRDTKSQYSELCDHNDMPRPQKSCDTDVACPHTTELEETTTTTLPCTPDFSPEEEEEEETTTVTEETTDTPTTTTTTEQEYVTILTQPPSNWSSVRSFFYVGPWGRCNGQGYRRRIVHCQIFLEFSQTVAKLPDAECPDVRPTDIEPCSVSCPPPHPPNERLKETTTTTTTTEESSFYSWNTEMFSPCTASCSGGMQMSIVRCLRLPGDVEVSPQLCNLLEKPEPLTRRCSEEPCPVNHRWNVSDYGECSKTCGGGIRTRPVKCLFIEDESEAEDEQCPGEKPKALDHCNVFDCPAEWKTEPWSKCSRSCAGGFQTRKLHCEKILAPLSQSIQLPPSKCLKTRPKAIKKCNLKPCPPTLRPIIKATTTTTTTAATTTTTTTTLAPATLEPPSSLVSEDLVFNQIQPNRRITLKAAGNVTLFKGSSAKFHCPIYPVSNTSRVLWFKGHLRIPPSTASGWPRVSVSGKGALRIRKITYADSGTYTCLSGAFRSDVIIVVKPLPPRIAVTPGIVTAEAVPSATPVPTVDIKSQARGNRSVLPQVRHFLVNMRHFEKERAEDGLQSHPMILEYEWIVGSWSMCSYTCGPAAIQIRTIECRVRVLNNATRVVPKGFCVDGGLPQPTTVRQCMLMACPDWTISEWSECSPKNCLSWETAYQKREVVCTMSNRTISPSQCDDSKRPRRKRECFNGECKGMWKISHWSECTATCGSKGFRSRSIQCVWTVSQDPAPLNACREDPPESYQACGRIPCAAGEEEDSCHDQSTYCDVVQKASLCRMSHFRMQCCASCGNQH